MSEPDDGGPVYPNPKPTSSVVSSSTGITRRDQCADRIAASVASDWLGETKLSEVDKACQKISALAYKLTDALIAEGRKE